MPYSGEPRTIDDRTERALDPARVSIAASAEPRYPCSPPFDPGERYPEYHTGSCAGEPNHAYHAVRRSLLLLGLDAGSAGTPSWNPLSEVVRPGDRVLIKPNLVRESREGRPGEWEQIITSASVVRAVLDYVLLALEGSGSVLIADSPQTDSDFTATVERSGLSAMVSEIARRSGMDISLRDLRSERWIVTRGICTGRIELPGDPLGVVQVDLGARSHFTGAEGTAPFYGAGYDTAETNLGHSGGRHRYEVCGSAMAADAIIAVPKLKTHKKCGMTGCLKGFIGLAGNKNLLPHYRMGPPSRGGDQFPDDRRGGRAENALVLRAKRALSTGGRGRALLAGLLRPLAYAVFGRTGPVIRSGNWPGNDTIWRSVLDLSAALAGAAPARRFLCVVDGIVCGEGNGPLDAGPNPAGLVVAGLSPLLVDAVSCAAAGLDPMAVRVVREAFSSSWGLAPCGPGDVQVTLPDGRSCRGLEAVPALARLKPHPAWSGVLERA